MEVSGKVVRVMPTQVVSEKYQKREVHIVTSEQYPQHLSIEFAQDKCALLDSIQVGTEVQIDINLRGREWNDPKTGTTKVFNTIQGWKITSNAAAPVATNQTQDDGLPF